MVMQYWVRQTPGLDAAASAAERIDRELAPTSHGLSGDELRRYFETHGFSAFVFSGEIGDLRDHTAKGRPVIVCLGPAARGELHYVVVTGVEANTAIFNDPARDKFIREPLDSFLRKWQASRNWALLAVPHPKP